MFARLRKRRALVIGVLVVLALIVAALAPWVLWHARADRPLDVLVVDKTVAKPDYRKHQGLFWVLKHEKIVQKSTGGPLALDRDYVGYQHSSDGQGHVVPIPVRPSDLVYVADTYGVYKDDLLERPLGLKSDLIYGGLDVKEVHRLTGSLKPGATLVAEFNCLASPTVGQAREELSNALGVRWTGWIGRHFSYLDLGADMPLWVPRTWKRQTGERWAFRGPGYVFVNEQGFLIVLREGIDTPTPAFRISVNEAAAKRYGTSRRQTYDYWFEIMTPLPGAEVLASFTLDLTDAGRQKMRGVPIDGPIPAIVRTQRPNHLAYYFAGDFADQPKVPESYRYRGLQKVRAWLGAEHRDDQQAFYWRVYVPMMQRIVTEAETAARRRANTADARS
jgi:hypothetical protein